ncbi:Dynamin-like GTPase that mediates homotypic ER fusion, partial [Mortierella alpina]
ARKTPVANYYANWNRWLPIMNAYEARKPSYFATPAVQNVYALHVSLKQIVAQGVEQRFVLHKEASAKAKKFIHDLGLKLVPTGLDHAANGMSAVYYPEGVAATDLLPKLAAHGIVAAGGLHVEIAPKYFRIGHMGISVTEPERGHLDATLNALKASLAECGYKGALERAQVFKTLIQAMDTAVPDIEHQPTRPNHHHLMEPGDPPLPTVANSAAHSVEAMTSLHLIDEQKHFSDALSLYINEKWHLKDAGFNYNVVAVFGSQSTGKSTLLNRLFGTHFDVMAEVARMQTTKGIWISRGKGMKALVMDVEGTDGRERGEDQDFERKSALFSLATSEVLIVNMWEHQVGLYNGANMGLLKTVFEVNLQLFGKNRGKEKTLLLFVIRDHVGSTPLENLSSTLKADLERIWHDLSKPEELEGCRISEYFDLQFTALPHKLLQPQDFELGIEQLRRRFTDPSDRSYVFQPQYSKRVPIDGLEAYAGAIWEKIMTNKDLDLPTQQELLAQFRCDEIANGAMAVFKDAIKEFRHPIETGHLVPDLGPKMKHIREVAITSFDKDASRYHAEVYKRKREEMLSKANTMLGSYFVGQLKNLHTSALSLFSSNLQHALKSEGAEFANVVLVTKGKAVEFFLQGARAIQLDDTDWAYEEELYQLERDIQALAVEQRQKELSKMLAGLEKQMKKDLDEPVKLALDCPGPGMWGRVITAYKRSTQEAEEALQRKARAFELEPEEHSELITNLERQGWILLTMRIQEESVDGLILYKLLNRFEERFQRDEQGLPRVWKPNDDINTPFRKARDETVNLIPIYAHINTVDPASGTPFALASSDDFDFDQSLKVLSESRQQELIAQLKRRADASYVEAKRSVVATQQKVPYWVGVALVILGWNEFISVITNPLYLSLTLTLGVPLAALWYLDLLSGAQKILWRLYGEGVQFGRQRIRDAAHPPEPVRIANYARQPQQFSDDREENSHMLHHRRSAQALGNNGYGDQQNTEDNGTIELEAFEDKKSL